MVARVFWVVVRMSLNCSGCFALDIFPYLVFRSPASSCLSGLSILWSVFVVQVHSSMSDCTFFSRFLVQQVEMVSLITS